MVYFREINSFLVWDASILVTVNSRQCLDVTDGKIENALERGLVKHRQRDRSFFMSMGGLVGFRGGPREKKWHLRGGLPKKN